jgi:hypothetical protein
MVSSMPVNGLTLRSRRGPTANRQARLQVRFIILPPGLALYRLSRLNSSVRPHENRIPSARQQMKKSTLRNRGRYVLIAASLGLAAVLALIDSTPKSIPSAQSLEECIARCAPESGTLVPVEYGPGWRPAARDPICRCNYPEK